MVIHNFHSIILLPVLIEIIIKYNRLKILMEVTGNYLKNVMLGPTFLFYGE